MVCESSVFSEEELHEKFSSHRFSGEWFALDEIITDEIKAINKCTSFEPYEIDRKINPFEILKFKEDRPKYLKLDIDRGMRYRRRIKPHLRQYLNNRAEISRMICRFGETMDQAVFDNRYAQAHSEVEALIVAAEKEHLSHCATLSVSTSVSNSVSRSIESEALDIDQILPRSAAPQSVSNDSQNSGHRSSRTNS